MAPVSGGYVVCGCTVIKEDVCLTAAHCTWNLGQFIIGFGIINFNEPQVQIETFSKREHPGYNGQSLDHDVSLLYLPQRLEWTDIVGPAHLPTRSQQGELWGWSPCASIRFWTE